MKNGGEEGKQSEDIVLQYRSFISCLMAIFLDVAIEQYLLVVGLNCYGKAHIWLELLWKSSYMEKLEYDL